MHITVEINNCNECRHRDHSGAFTIGGAREICGHSDACKVRKTITEFKSEYPAYAERDLTHWKHHWYNRITDTYKGVPDWCPLKLGSAY